MTVFNLNYFFIGPNIVTLGVRASIYQFERWGVGWGGTQFRP